jgi:hypothetical protein
VEKEKGLHELYEYLPDDIDFESLIVLRLDVSIDIHAKHFSNDTLRYAELTMCPLNSKSPLISTMFLLVDPCSLTTFKILT